MPRDTLLLVRRADDDDAVAATHARRLRDRGVADEVRVASYGSEPARDLAPVLADVEADRLYVAPLCLAHTNRTVEDVPAALARIDATVRYCEPVGRNPAITGAIVDRATARVPAEGDASLVLVGFGASSADHERETVEWHATRARERATYGEVVTCYLQQNPTVECVRYNVGDGPVVAVPLFVAPSEATDERIPAKLELERGGLAYADPLGTHPLVTDAVEAAVAKRRVADGDGDAGPNRAESFEERLTATASPVATDGDGGAR